MNIRLASINDVKGIALVHVASWKTTYKGIISDTYLSNLSIEGRMRNWTESFNNPNKDVFTFVLEDQNEQIVGFITGGISREAELDFHAELYAIYLLRSSR